MGPFDEEGGTEAADAVLAEVREALADPDDEVRRASLEQMPPGWYFGGVTVLCLALGDTSWRVRKQAVERISSWPDPDGIVPALIAALSETGNVGLRNAAVEALTRLGRPSVAPLVTAFEAGGEHRKMIVDALGAIGDPAALSTLCAALEDPDENVRAAGAEALGACATDPPPEVVAALEQALSRTDLMTRLGALEAMSRLGIAVPVARLRPILEQPILRRAGLEALGYSADVEALPYLLDGLADRARGVREASIIAIWKMRGALEDDGRRRIDDALRRSSPEVVDALVRAVSAEDRRVRRGACMLLGATRTGAALPALVNALLDDEVHDHAAAAIVQFGPAAVGGLCVLCRDLDAELRGAVFALLPRLGAAASDPRIAALLTEAVEDDEGEAAATAARALGDLGGKEALAPLLRTLEREDREVALAAADALGRLGTRYYDEVRMLVQARGLAGPTAPSLCRVLGAIGRPGDEALLLGALRSDDPDVRQAAAEALPAIGGGAEVVEALTFAIADESPAVRAGAVRSLASLPGARDARASSVVDALVAATFDEQHSVSIAAIRALGGLERARAVPRLLELCRSERSFGPGGREQGAGIAAHAIDALCRITRGSAPDVEEVLLSLVAHPDVEVVKAALRGLGHFHSDAAISSLIEGLAHSRWDVRKMAVESLVAAGGAKVQRALKDRTKTEPDTLVKEAISRALGRLERGSKGPGPRDPAAGGQGGGGA
jgi:HEAT repeat protein